MLKKKLIKILATEKPKTKFKDIIFIDPLKTKNNLNEFISYSLDKNFYKYMEMEFLSKKEIINYFDKIVQTDIKINDKILSQKFWFVKCLKLNKIIGSAKLSDFSLDRKSVQWGYGVGSNFRKHNYLIKIQLTLIDYIFNKIKFNRLWGQTHQDNIGVINSQQILNFRNEGIKYDFYFNKKKNKYFNAYAYSFLKRDYDKYIKLNKNLNIKDNIDIKKINIIICKTLKVKRNLSSNIEMKKENTWDSLNHYDIITSLEKKLKINFTSDQLIELDSSFNILEQIKN